jgi:hypothetical protein
MNSVDPFSLPDLGYLNKTNVDNVLRNINYVVENPNNNEPYKVIELLNIRNYIYQNIDAIKSR